VTTGEGFVILDLDDGQLDGMVSVVRLEDGYVMVAVTDNGKCRRAIITSDQARALANALTEAAKGRG
jgi:hypothetical protein